MRAVAMSEKKSEKLVPQLRFRGFTDDWEQRKLGEVLIIRSGADQKKIETSQGKYPILATGGEIGRTDTPIYSQPSVLIGRKGTIDRPVYMDTPFWTVDTLFYSEILSGNNARFLYTLFQSIPWKQFDTSTGVPSLTSSTIQSIKKRLPSENEQNKIAELFKTLDSLIAAHERKLELLKKKKNYYLQQIFSQKLRFKGFDEPWRQRKLYSILEERNILESPSEEHPLVSFTVENGVTPKSERYDRSFLVRTSEKQYKYTKVDDIVYNPANLKFGAIARNSFGDAVFSPIYVTFKIKDSSVPHFIEYLVTKKSFITKALTYQEGTVYERMSVKPKDFLQLNVSVPYSTEQKKLARFLESFDFLMTAQERKINLLKKQKQAYLQKMFV
jgi:type I restriction enzyme S subunit